MEEKKLSIEQYNIGLKRDLSSQQQKLDEQDPKLMFAMRDNSKYLGDGYNDNWYELRFSSLGPDRRGYHSSF